MYDGLIVPFCFNQVVHRRVDRIHYRQNARLYIRKHTRNQPIGYTLRIEHSTLERDPFLLHRPIYTYYTIEIYIHVYIQT